MKIFDITLGTGNENINELFYRGKARFSRQYGTLRIACGDTVSFSTFFNLFPYYEYYHYCGISKPQLSLDIVGVYTVKIFYMDPEGESHQLATELKQGKSTTAVDIPNTVMGGFIYFTITAATACLFKSGSWNADKEQERPVKIGLIICTYNREQFVKTTMEKLQENMAKDPVWANRLHVFIVDNAQNLFLPESSLYTVYPNRNLGGSGGFARGMYELSKHEEYTHMLLMDDDIQVDFNTLKRTYYLLCALSEAHKDAAIGGVMLKLETPYKQQEFGAQFNGLNVRSINGRLDVRLEENLLKNQDAEKADFNGWWYCCMPSHFVKDYGLPMPFFIKTDDVEYCIRTCKEIIIMNGLAIWHQDFDNKYSRVLEYYSRRNQMITAVMHHRCNRFKAVIRYAYFMFKGLVLKNYMGVELVYRSFLDFKKGPSFLVKTDAVILNKLINDKAPVYTDKETLEKRYNIEDLHYDREANEHKKHHNRFFVLMEAFIPESMLSDEVGVTDAGNPAAMDSFMKKNVIHYDPLREKGYMCSFDKKERRKYRRATIRTIFQLLFFYDRYKKLYSNCSSLCSAEQWEKTFFPAVHVPADKKEHKSKHKK